MRVLMVLLAVCCLCSAAEEPLPVFLFAGQSNMVGKRCRVGELPEPLRGPLGEALFFDPAAGWIPLEAGRTEPEGFGPEITFAPDMAKHLGRSFGVIKHAVGGTNLHTDWNPDRAGSLYQGLRDKVAQAAAARPIRIIGMVWSQGGADAKAEATAKAYGDHLRNLIVRARADFTPELAFVCVRSNPQDKSFIEIVRSAQQHCAEPRYAWVDSDTFALGSDRLHYTTTGMIDSGRGCAAAMISLLRARAR